MHPQLINAPHQLMVALVKSVLEANKGPMLLEERYHCWRGILTMDLLLLLLTREAARI